MTGEGLDGHADQEAEYGETAVETLGTLQFRVADLLGSGVQEQGVIGLGGRANGKDGVDLARSKSAYWKKQHETSQGLDVLPTTYFGLMPKC